jgi:hypothetical protein
MTGTPNQVEWAERIRIRVNDEFDRVVRAFRSVAARQNEARQAETEAIVGMVEEMRVTVMARQEAGYFIHEWQEIGDQVRQQLFRDARYQKIKSGRSTPPPEGSTCPSPDC